MINLGNGPGRFFVQTNNDSNTEFINRQKNVFEKLDAVMSSNETSISKHNRNKRNIVNEDTKSYKKQKSETRPFRGQESIFKRPEAPPPSRFQKNLPDFLRHPEKWTKYTLSDVSQDDMSDHTNTAAAMSFLRELRAKKEAEDMDVDDNNETRISFKKPQRKREVNLNEEGKIKCTSQSFKSSKVIMPEYVVGEKKLSKSKRQKDKPEKGKEIKLDHLEEEEEEHC